MSNPTPFELHKDVFSQWQPYIGGDFSDALFQDEHQGVELLYSNGVREMFYKVDFINAAPKKRIRYFRTVGLLPSPYYYTKYQQELTAQSKQKVAAMESDYAVFDNCPGGFLDIATMMLTLHYTDRGAFMQFVRKAKVPHVKVNARKILFNGKAVKEWLLSKSKTSP